MNNKLKILIFIFSLILIIFGTFTISESVYYESSGGPFNFSFSHVISIFGFISIIISIILFHFFAKNKIIISITYLISSILIFILGINKIVSSRKELNDIYIDKLDFVTFEINKISLFIYLMTVILLFIIGISGMISKIYLKKIKF